MISFEFIQIVTFSIATSLTLYIVVSSVKWFINKVIGR